MNALATVEQQLKSWPQPQVGSDDNIVVVPTHFLYPSMTVVQTLVECDGCKVRVSDGGGAFREICETGPLQFDVVKLLSSQANAWDLSVTKEGWVQSKPVAVEQVADMVAWVATASHNLATKLLEKISSRPKARDFRQDLEVYLETRYKTGVAKKKTVIGASNKKHKFDYFLTPNGKDRGVLIDAVLNDGSSINAAVVAHMDVANAELEGIAQRIIYDDREEWKASDLSLLRVGATPLAFSNLDTTLSRAMATL